MAVRPPEDPYRIDDGSFVDYDVYDLEDVTRQPASHRPRPGVTRGRSADSLVDPRFLVPLLLFLCAIFVITMAWRSRGSSADSAALQQEQAAVEVSDLARRVNEAQLRAGFDGLTITEQDGVIIIEGQAQDALTAASIGAVARSVDGTQRVDNRVVVPGGAIDVSVAGVTSVAPGAQTGTLTAQLDALDQITFETGSSALTTAGAVVVDSAAAILGSDPGARIEIHGHTDSEGDDTRNQVLSQERAQAVATALIARGIDPARLTAVGFGESKPLEPNITEQGRAVNRRIEFLVLR